MLNIKNTYKKSGIYKITNLMTEQLYIGSAKDLGKRLSLHYRSLSLNQHPNIHLQRAWNKYGELLFVAEVVEFCTLETLLAKEQYWIDLTKAARRPNYNICPTAYSMLGRKQSLEEIEKRRLKLIGRQYSQESKHNMSKGRLGMKFSPEHCASISKVKQGVFSYTKPVIQFDRNFNIIKEWSSAAEASKLLKISFGGISDCARNKKKTHKGFIWKSKLAM